LVVDARTLLLGCPSGLSPASVLLGTTEAILSSSPVGEASESGRFFIDVLGPSPSLGRSPNGGRDKSSERATIAHHQR
jgi:hypothetical protein